MIAEILFGLVSLEDLMKKKVHRILYLLFFLAALFSTRNFLGALVALIFGSILYISDIFKRADVIIFAGFATLLHNILLIPISAVVITVFAWAVGKKFGYSIPVSPVLFGLYLMGVVVWKGW